MSICIISLLNTQWVISQDVNITRL